MMAIVVLIGMTKQVVQEKGAGILRLFSLAIRAGLVAAMLDAIIQQELTIFFVSAVTLLLVLLAPRLLERSYHIELPIEFEFLISLFLFASLFLGHVGGYYARFWWWDVILHTGAGFGFALIGFLMLYALREAGEVKARPGVIAFLAFSFAMSLGALWEIFEFAADGFWGTNLQHGDLGPADTMWDLVVNAIGAVLVSVSGVYYLREGKGNIARRAVNALIRRNPSLFS